MHRLALRLIHWLPFFLWLPKVTPKTAKLDLTAAITSAIFALPQGLAFALIAGLPPEFGLYAAMIAPLVTALFGCSWHTVSGPTVPTSIVIISILSGFAVPASPQFIGLALLLTLLAGIIQFTLGIFRLGHLVNFISHTVILGFSSGAAILIIVSQLGTFFGIDIARQDNIAMTLQLLFQRFHQIDLATTSLSVTTLVVALLCAKYYKKLPNLLIAMAAGTILAFIMTVLFNVEQITMVGALPSGLPQITIPNLSWFQASELFASAIALATLGLIQSVSIAKTVSNKTGQPINANQEFVAQGLSNMACSFTSGFFSSCSFTRTGVNYAAGAVTPLSSIFASGFILLVLIFAAGITAYLPLASMSAIIIIAGYKLIDFAHIKKIIQTSHAETAIYVLTLLATLFLSLEFAIYSGMFLALILYLQKTSQPKVVSLTVDQYDPYHRLIELPSTGSEHPKLAIIRVDGSLFFGSIDHIYQVINQSQAQQASYILLIGDGVNLIDISGAELLLRLKQYTRRKGGDLYLSGLTPAVRKYLSNSPYWDKLGGRSNIYNYQAEAINQINQLLDASNADDADPASDNTDNTQPAETAENAENKENAAPTTTDRTSDSVASDEPLNQTLPRTKDPKKILE